MQKNKAQTPKLYATTDLCDAHEAALKDGSLRILPAIFQNYGGESHAAGPVLTLKCFEDNSLVRTVLEGPGQGRVLMVDGGGSDRCALVGGNLGLLAEQNGWAGVVVYGCVRDTMELSELSIGIWAISTHPRRSEKLGAGVRDVPVDMAGVVVRPGNWCFADPDGLVVSDRKLG